MSLTFAPNNNEYSKFLFTGRSKDIDTLLKEITSGNCVALYGERRSGKTLTLQMMKEIINNRITDDGKIISSQLSQLRLVDQNLLQTISVWRAFLLSYNAILVSLHGKRTEVELFESIVNELAEIPIDISEKSLVSPLAKDNTINGLRSLLEQLQSYLIKKKEKLVVLMDEMETLSKFRKGVAIAEEFCKTTEYTEIVFIHTGSYTWREHVYERGSLFNHLEPYFLTSINEQDMRRFLLQPLTRKEQKDFVVQMSGCKPLYAQYIGEILYESDKEITQYDLLDIRSLCQKVKQNIFEEQALDKISKLLLSTLSHYQDVSEEWLTEKLKIDQSLIKAKLYNLVDFGTISVLEKKYKICGSFIELYGRDICTNPIQEQTYVKRFTSLLKWSL
ncbi:MAG: AAA family ATPase, partial [Bacteroidota bacterium]